MKEKEIKNMNEAEEIKVDMTVNEPEETETKKEKAWNFTKKVGMAIWKGVKTTCTGVGALVLGALMVGIALDGKKEDENSSEYSGGELNTDDTTASTANETSDETSNEEFDL